MRTLSRNRFDYKLYGHFLSELKKGKAARREHDAYSSYSYYPKGCVQLGVHTCEYFDALVVVRPHCDKGRRPGRVAAPGAVGSFPA